MIDGGGYDDVTFAIVGKSGYWTVLANHARHEDTSTSDRVLTRSFSDRQVVFLRFALIMSQGSVISALRLYPL